MQLVDRLRKESRLYATCPHCNEEFKLSRADLFSIKGPLPAPATQKIEELHVALKQRREQLRKRKEQVTTGAQRPAEAVNLGKVLERIAPSFSSFGFAPPDCRAI